MSVDYSGCNHKQVVRENIVFTGTGEDAETSSTTTESSTHDDGDKVSIYVYLYCLPDHWQYWLNCTE